MRGGGTMHVSIFKSALLISYLCFTALRRKGKGFLIILTYYLPLFRFPSTFFLDTHRLNLWVTCNMATRKDVRALALVCSLLFSGTSPAETCKSR
jgi:hypothetical protein